MVVKKKNNTFVPKMVRNKEFIRNLRSFSEIVSLCDAFGKVLEWLKRHAWKACIRQKRIRGSNPLLSARNENIVIIYNSIN